jgi:hypothetical protein
VTITADDLHAVRPAVSRDRKHPAALRCVLVERVGDVVRVVATDRHRLVVHERAATADDPQRVLLDPETLEPAPGVADEFPDYERFLAADPDAVTATMAAADLRRAVEDATDDDAPLAVMVDEDGVRLGADALLYVNSGYLHDAVLAAGDGDLVVTATGDRAPLVVRGHDVVTLLMPVRVAN